MTAALREWFATARLPASIKINSGEYCENVPLYVAAQLRRMNGTGKAQALAADKLKHLKQLIEKKV